MRNFVSAGATLTFTNGGTAVASGEGVILGALFGVAAGPIAANAEGVLNLTGEYDLAKAASQAWTVGQVVYWNGTTKVATTVATDAVLIGVATQAVTGAAGNTIGRVRLNGSFG